MTNIEYNDMEINTKVDIDFAMRHFCISEEDIRITLGVAMANGADYADLYFEHSTSNDIRLKDNAVDSASSQIEYGVGVRVIIGSQTGFAYTESITREELVSAARSAAMIAKQDKEVGNIVDLKSLGSRTNLYPEVSKWEDQNIENKKPYLERLNEKMFALDNRVKKTILTLGDGTSHIFFVNTLGEMYYDFIPIAMLSAFCLMEDGDKREQGGASRSFRMGAEFLDEELLRTIAQEAVGKTSILFEAIKPKGGEMPVVMGAGGSGILLHEAIGHAFEADFIRKGTSIFTDSLGKQICNKDITVVDDGTIAHNRGSINFDDEGIATQKTCIIENGVLNSFLHDRISAKHFGVAPTGNGRRESFRYPPIPRMRATYMENGCCTQEDIISSVKNGVFVDVFTNGQVQIGAGDFTFYVKSGYMIENGKLTRPIKDINIIGNGPLALSDISMVGNNSVIDNGTWTCGKDGQSCPVTCGMPSVLVNKLTVGGL